MNRRSFLGTLSGLGVLATFGRRASAAPVASNRGTLSHSEWWAQEYRKALGNRSGMTNAAIASSPPEVPWDHWTISGMTRTANGETRIHSRKLVVPVRTLDIPRLLRCIAERETRNQDQVIGRSGERSRYQIKRTTWFQHESAPFAYCRGERAYCVALNHVNWLRTKLNDTDSVWMLAYAWNDGLGFRHKARVVEYAAAVENLYYDSTFAG